MTLDQIARLVQSSMPGLPTQLVRAHINTAYRGICSQWQWSFLEGEYGFTTMAPVTGSLNTSTMVISNLSGSLPNPASVPLHCHIGDSIYRVSGISNDVLSVSPSYIGPQGSSVSVTFFRHQYLLDSSVDNLLQVRCGGRRLEECDEGGLSTYRAGRPSTYRKAGYLNGQMVIELKPIPGSAYVVWYKAKKRIADLGPNDEPLIEPQLLLYVTLLDLIPTYIGMFPDATYHIKQSAPEWRLSRDRLYGDLIMDDISKHSTSDRVKDKFFTATDDREVYSVSDLEG